MSSMNLTILETWIRPLSSMFTISWSLIDLLIYFPGWGWGNRIWLSFAFMCELFNCSLFLLFLYTVEREVVISTFLSQILNLLFPHTVSPFSILSCKGCHICLPRSASNTQAVNFTVVIRNIIDKIIY